MREPRFRQYPALLSQVVLDTADARRRFVHEQIGSARISVVGKAHAAGVDNGTPRNVTNVWAMNVRAGGERFAEWLVDAFQFHCKDRLKRGQVAMNIGSDGNAHLESSGTRRRSLFDMEAAAAILANRAVPSVSIARDQCIDFCGEPADSRYLQNPCEQIPTGEQLANARPRISTAIDAALWVNYLHPFQGFFAIDLREALRRRGVMQVEQFDAAARIKAAHAICAGAT